MIDSIMIDRQYQRKEYGKEALIHVLKYIESKPLGDADSIKLLCTDDNTVAINIYEKAGFHKTNKIINKEKRLRVYTKKIKNTN